MLYHGSKMCTWRINFKSMPSEPAFEIKITFTRLPSLLFSFVNILLVNRNKINFFFLILSFFITLKLHFEYNEKRKFHDLRDVNLSKSNKAELIDNSLKGLNWITLSYKDSPSLEIKRLQNVMDYISKEKDPKILITHYLFISSILKQNLHSPSKFYTLDGVSFPLKGNKYYRDYKIFLQI